MNWTQLIVLSWSWRVQLCDSLTSQSYPSACAPRARCTGVLLNVTVHYPLLCFISHPCVFAPSVVSDECHPVSPPRSHPITFLPVYVARLPTKSPSLVSASLYNLSDTFVESYTWLERNSSESGSFLRQVLFRTPTRHWSRPPLPQLSKPVRKVKELICAYSKV